MTRDRSDLDHRRGRTPPSGHVQPASRGAVDAFLAEARQMAPAQPAAAGTGAARLILALDATQSRQPGWDLAQSQQGEMFRVAGDGGLAVQLVYYRGLDECRASRWTGDAQGLARAMSRIDCRGGRTQIARVLSHAVAEARVVPVKALVFVGDALEEPQDVLDGHAADLALLGVRAFIFQEGHDPVAAAGFQRIARMTGGALLPFDSTGPDRLRALLGAVAAFVSHGPRALDRPGRADPAALRLLADRMGGG
ncbi:VWA domain-containing protein [Tistrella bauzanensis]|nr:VWA domain-containing protein [Tistrella bauzanensis]